MSPRQVRRCLQKLRARWRRTHGETQHRCHSRTHGTRRRSHQAIRSCAQGPAQLSRRASTSRRPLQPQRARERSPSRAEHAGSELIVSSFKFQVGNLELLELGTWNLKLKEAEGKFPMTQTGILTRAEIETMGP